MAYRLSLYHDLETIALKLKYDIFFRNLIILMSVCINADNREF